MKRIILLFTFFCCFSAFAHAQEMASVFGYVKDGETGQELIAANVALVEKNKGVSSDTEGFYELDAIEPGTYKLVLSYVGYQKFEQSITLEPSATVRLDIEMKPLSYMMEEVHVLAEEEIFRTRNIGIAHVNTEFINKLPSVIQADVFRSLQYLPGVASASDFSSGLYIRGGSPDQTLIMLDDAPIYNPSHFFGFYSTFNPAAIDDIDLYKGNYPAKYGGRLGSVVSLSNKKGDTDKLGGNISLGLLAASASLEGPLDRKGKGSWMVAVRRSTLDPALNMLNKHYEDIPETFYFYDINGKLTYKPDSDNKLSVSMYSGKDKLDFPYAEDGGIVMDYGNQLLSTSWTHILSNRALTKLSFSASRYFNYPVFNMASSPYRRLNNISEFSLKSDTDILLNNNHQLSVGFWIQQRNVKLIDDHDGNKTENLDDQSLITSFYIQDDWNISNRFTLSQGLRVNRPGSGDFLQVEPRVSLEYRPFEDVRVQAAYGRYYQSLSMVSNESFSGLDVWVTANEDVQPASGEQYAIGIKTNPWSGFRLDIESYYRTMDNLFQPEPFVPDQSGMISEIAFRNGEGYAYGTEILFEKKKGKLTGFLSYTFGVTRRRFNQESNSLFGEPTNGFYPANFDRNHSLNLVTGYSFNKRWSVSAVFHYASGQPYTKPLGRSISFHSPFSDLFQHQLLVGETNGSRLPDYHRLDIGIQRTGTFFKVGKSTFNLQVINIYSRRNVWFYEFYAADTLERTKINLLPMLPSISYEIEF